MDISLLKIFLSFVILYFLHPIGKWLIKYIKDLRTYYPMKGLPMLPFIGNLHQTSTDSVSLLREFYNISLKFKDEAAFKFWRGTTPIIFFHRAEHLDVMFARSENQIKSDDYKIIEPWLKDGLLMSRNEKWSIRRKMITPTFHFDILTDFLISMNTNTEIMVNKLAEHANTGEEFDICHYLHLSTLDIICETAMGVNIDAQNKSESDYIKAINEVSSLMLKRMWNPFIKNDFAYSLTKDGKKYQKGIETLHKFTNDVIKKRDEEFELNNLGTQKRIAFLDLMLKYKHSDGSLTLEDIQEEVATFMFAGHDTTSTSLSWSFHLIGSHPEVQKKIHDELDGIFGDSDRHVTNEDLGKMNYLERCIKEQLRIVPAVPVHSRHVTADTVVDGLKVSKGAIAYIFSYSIHHNSDYFPNPEKYDPDRFLPENTKDRHQYAYIPFSAGKRNCIGQRFAMMEMKVTLAMVLRKYKIESENTIESLKPTMDLVCNALNGVQVKITKRR